MPKKTSTKEKKLKGTLRSDRTKTRVAAKPLAVAPAPDAGLDEIALAEWNRVVDAMQRSGMLTALDASALAAYCLNFSRWKKAEAALARDGAVVFVPVRDTHGHVTHEKPIKNPMLAVSESAQRLMHKFAESLGLSVHARSKMGFEVDPEETDDEGSGSDLLDMLRAEAAR